ncbi:hypothetical protein HNR42_002974 [Deinobacterium chartae]|uniref:Uncharacterized protein n=1 Tax=Deinobacterium chartae TaxID=521158 RepID=A0A841I3B6_9DEIO|nr:hypothetical protein [Deinobacterium chartae]MBB6099524.1 hypothetical protein [Deinobacterium chartae]
MAKCMMVAVVNFSTLLADYGIKKILSFATLMLRKTYTGDACYWKDGSFEKCLILEESLTELADELARIVGRREYSNYLRTESVPVEVVQQAQERRRRKKTNLRTAL